MMCTNDECNGRLRVTHTYTVMNMRQQRATCRRCGSVYRLETVQALVRQRGEGARATAEALKRKAAE